MSFADKLEGRKNNKQIQTFDDITGAGENAPKDDQKGEGTTGATLDQFYQKESTIEKKQVSIYLDTDVIKAFNKFGKENGKGAKSDLVNNFLKQVFNIRQG